MAFHLKKVETFHLRTSDEVRSLAMKLKGHGGTDCERAEKKDRKATIKSKILAGEMLPFKWAVGRCRTTGVTRRVNGQHSSAVFLEMTPEEWPLIKFPVVIMWEEYDCDEPKDIAVLFEQFDPAWGQRKPEDLIGAHMGVHENMHIAITRKIALCVADGLVWYRKRVEGVSQSPDARFHIIHENGDVHDFMTYCGSFLQHGKTDEMHAIAVIAAMYHCVQAGGSDAKAFWKRVATGKAQLDADAIEYKLAEFLDLSRSKNTEWPATIRRHFKGSKNKPSPLDIFATCIRGYFASVRGTKVADIFTPSKGDNAAQIVEKYAAAKKAA